MSKSAIIHIGMHKTGSTSIQECLFGHGDSNFTFSSFLGKNHSIPIYTIFSKNYKKYHIWERLGHNDQKIDKIREGFIKSLKNGVENETRIVVFSGEDISTLTISETESLKLFFDGLFDDIKIYAYVRCPIQFVDSSTAQILKDGVPIRGAHGLDYEFLLKKFYTVFGDENVNIRIYDPNLLKDCDVVSDFCEWIGMKMPQSKNIVRDFCEWIGMKMPQSRNIVRENVGGSLEAGKIFYIFAHDIRAYGHPLLIDARTEFIEKLSDALPGKFRLPKWLAIQNISMSGVSWLQSKLDSDPGWVSDLSLVDSSKVRPGSFNEFMRDVEQNTIEKLLNLIDNKYLHDGTNYSVQQVIARHITKILSKHDPRVLGFDAQKYLDINQDVANSGIDPFIHFIRFGYKEKRLFR